jgi:AraC-like DNA-binding protein
MIYFTKLPDHKGQGFDEQLHFNKFKQHNIVFNALASKSHCDRHAGCLSIKTVMNGEEVYGFNGLRKSVRPGQFLILNDDQQYSSRIDGSGKVKSLSVFFTKNFASAVFRDALQNEESLLDLPFETGTQTPEFFQTLYPFDKSMQGLLAGLIAGLNNGGESADLTADEDLIFLLRHLITVHQSEVSRSRKVNAIKPGTRTEIYKRLCVAKDHLHSTFTSNLDLATVSTTACLSVPQLIRQFKAVFQTTPHQYLIRIRLAYGAGLLKSTHKPVNEIALASGFENTSAFCRAFKTAYGNTPLAFRTDN